MKECDLVAVQRAGRCIVCHFAHACYIMLSISLVMYMYNNIAIKSVVDVLRMRDQYAHMHVCTYVYFYFIIIFFYEIFMLNAKDIHI